MMARASKRDVIVDYKDDGSVSSTVRTVEASIMILSSCRRTAAAIAKSSSSWLFLVVLSQRTKCNHFSLLEGLFCKKTDDCCHRKSSSSWLFLVVLSQRTKCNHFSLLEGLFCKKTGGGGCAKKMTKKTKADKKVSKCVSVVVGTRACGFPA
jgi:hypothetical protein